MSQSKPSDTPPEDLTFEQAMEELETIVADLESGRSTLDELVTRYARGAQLLERSRKLLGDAELKLSKLDEGGQLTSLSQPDT